MTVKTERRQFAHSLPTQSKRERVDVAVIGAGQAGLAISYYLTEQGRDHLLLERANRLAERTLGLLHPGDAKLGDAASRVSLPRRRSRWIRNPRRSRAVL